MNLPSKVSRLIPAVCALMLTYFCFCTPNPTIGVPQANENNKASTLNQDSFPASITEAQMDTLMHNKGKFLPPSLCKTLLTGSIPDTTTVFRLVGQLDADNEPEHVIWYQYMNYGFAVVLDHKNGYWQKSEPVFLDFYRGDHLPRMDAQARALLTYSYGSGSGYGSEVLHFYQLVSDSLSCVFKFLKLENARLTNYCGAFRTIKGNYTVKNQGLILASYQYKVAENKSESNRIGRTLFSSRINIPFRRSAAQHAFLPTLPDGFSEESTVVYLDDGEYSFDYFYAAALSHLKQHGPGWKRRALCNYETL